MAADFYYARLCWNDAGWTHPSGSASSAEQANDTYATRHGYGHEEWLFNFQWMVDGWKYGFLQPVNKSYEKVVGKSIGVRLYTVGPEKRWYYVGELRRCEVVTEEQAAIARKAFQKRRWLSQMKEQLAAVGGNVGELGYDNATSLFNIRFRREDAELYDPIRLVGEGDALRKLRRYTLTAALPARGEIERQWAKRTATTQPRPTAARPRAPIPSGTVNPVEAQLQNELFLLLRAKYGARAVLMEHDFVDLKIVGRKGVTLVELKGDSRPRRAVREALGQLAYYACHAEAGGDVVNELVVVGPGRVSALDMAFLEHLRKRWGMPIRYVCFQSGMRKVEL
jgi:hypothetical protein